LNRISSTDFGYEDNLKLIRSISDKRKAEELEQIMRRFRAKTLSVYERLKPTYGETIAKLVAYYDTDYSMYKPDTPEAIEFLRRVEKAKVAYGTGVINPLAVDRLALILAYTGDVDHLVYEGKDSVPWDGGVAGRQIANRIRGLIKRLPPENGSVA
jgi:outer membrane phospholipase A